MTDFVIETGVPFPPESHRAANAKKGGRKQPPKLPWDTLEVGHAVKRPTRQEAVAGCEWARRHARCFVMEKQKDGSGWRVWRRA